MGAVAQCDRSVIKMNKKVEQNIKNTFIYKLLIARLNSLLSVANLAMNDFL
jgi:hypothetical protein